MNDASGNNGKSAAAPGGRSPVLWNFALLSGGEFIAKILTFLAFTHLGRILGPESYGNLEFTLAVMVFFTMAVDLGLGSYGAREIAKDRERATELLRDISELRFLLGALSFLLMVGFAFAIDRGPDARWLLVTFGFSLVASPGVLLWFFQGHDLMNWVALASIVRWTVFTALVFALIEPGAPIYWVGVIECISVGAVVAFCLWVVRARMALPFPKLSLSFRALMIHGREALPIGLCDFCWALLWYFATILLGLSQHGEELGWFGAAHRAALAVHTFVWLYFFNLLPSLSRCYGGPPERFQALLGRSLRLACWGGVFLALGLAIPAETLLTVAYGDEFAGAAIPFVILIALVPISLISGHYRYALIAYHLQDQLFWWAAASALAAVVSALALIPKFGMEGAASALLIGNIIYFGLAYLTVRRRIAAVPFAPHLAQPIVAAALACLAGYWSASAPEWLRTVTACTVYLVLFFWWQRHHLPSFRRLAPQAAMGSVEPAEMP